MTIMAYLIYIFIYSLNVKKTKKIFYFSFNIIKLYFYINLIKFNVLFVV